jgi:hypothetical protein
MVSQLTTMMLLIASLKELPTVQSELHFKYLEVWSESAFLWHTKDE